MRKVYLDLKVKVILEVEEGIEISDIISEIDIGGKYVYDYSIEYYEITDSK